MKRRKLSLSGHAARRKLSAAAGDPRPAMALLSNNYDKQSAMSEEVLSYAKMVAQRMLVKADRMLRDSNQDP